MIKVHPWRFHKSLQHFNLMNVRGCSETPCFRELSNQVFHSLYFRKYISYEYLLFVFSKSLVFYINSRIGTKNSENVFGFLDNGIWIGRSKFSKFRRLYLSSEVNVLTNTPEISQLSLREIFSKAVLPKVMENYDKSAAMQFWHLFVTL